MKLSTPRYTLCLFFQFIFILCDIIFNCVSLFPRSRDGLLVLFIFQDLFLVLSITTMLMTFFSTYLFQTGLVEALARKFGVSGLVCALYAAASASLHAAWLAWRGGAEGDGGGGGGGTPPVMLAMLFAVQRCLSPWYYFFYKRAALRVSDPRFYEDIDWINRQLQQR